MYNNIAGCIDINTLLWTNLDNCYAHGQTELLNYSVYCSFWQWSILCCQGCCAWKTCMHVQAPTKEKACRLGACKHCDLEQHFSPLSLAKRHMTHQVWSKLCLWPAKVHVANTAVQPRPLGLLHNLRPVSLQCSRLFEKIRFWTHAGCELCVIRKRLM